MIEFGLCESCAQFANDAIEIVKLQRKSSSYSFNEDYNLVEYDSNENESENSARYNNLSLLKLNLNTSTNCCRLCNQLHSTNNTESTQVDRRFSLIDNINNKNGSSMRKNSASFSTLFKTPVGPQSDPIKSLIESIKSFQSTSQNFEQELRKSCDVIRKKIANSVQSNLMKVNENHLRLVKELDTIQQTCLNSVDKESQFWKELEILIKANKLDCDAIQFYLNQDEQTQSDEPTNNLIEEFAKLLDTKVKEFNSYILMDKKIQFKANPEFKIDENSIGFLNYSQVESIFNPETRCLEPRVSSFQHLSDLIEQNKPHIPCSTSLDLTSTILLDTDKFNYLSVYSLDSVDCLLICNRYAKSNQPTDIYCDLYLIDIDGCVVKTVNIKNSFVRCINTNSSYVLLTIENDQTETNKNFELNLYDSSLSLVKNARVVDTNHLVEANSSLMHPVSICLDNDKVFVFKNTIPFINVYDLNLNLLTIFGQDINSSYKYFVKRTHNYICVKSNCLYSSQVSAKGTTISKLDLNNGLNDEEIEVEFSFSNFCVINQSKSKSEILFFCTSSKKLVVFDLKAKKATFSCELNEKCVVSNEQNFVSSYCFTKRGFMATIMSNTADRKSVV